MACYVGGRGDGRAAHPAWWGTHPLAAAVFAFGLLTVVDVASLVVGVDWRGLDTNIVVLLLPYVLFRWGSGRHAVIGLAVMAIPLLLSGFDAVIHPAADEAIPFSNVVVGGLVELVVAAVGAVVRYQDKARARGMDQVKLLEREQLARELHDTVAHHVSAILEPTGRGWYRPIPSSRSPSGRKRYS